MNKRLFWLAPVILILLACEPGEETISLPTSIPSPATSTPLPSSATPFSNPTLPPAATISLGGATARPTRTPAPTITLAPSATSNLNPEITSAAATPAQSDEQGATLDGNTITFLVGWEELGRLLSDSPGDGGGIVDGSYQVLIDDSGTALVTFDVLAAGQSPAGNVTGVASFDLLSERVFAAVTSAYYTNNPGQPYTNTGVIAAFNEHLQNTVDTALERQVLIAIGEARPFAVTAFTLSAAGMNVSVVYQQ